MKHVLLTGLLILTLSCMGKEQYSIEVHGAENFTHTVALSVDMDSLPFPDFILTNRKKHVPFQIDSISNCIWFLHQPGQSTIYKLDQLVIEKDEKQSTGVSKKDGNLQLTINDNPLVQYRYEMNYPPMGVDSIFRKSGYVHPIMTLRGDTLTRIQPPDHWHHYGLWGPWTHTQVNGQRVDFWNLGEGMGTVLFKEFGKTSSGNIYATFNAKQEHIDLKTRATPQIALNEELKLTLWNLDLPDRYMVDYVSRFNSPLEGGLLFEAYRYGGGIGLRFHKSWKADNSSVLTSEGKDRLTADGSNARWCIITGTSSKGGSSGILLMSHPENRMHPEPIRVWPMDANEGRGDMFFEFCPIRNEEWKIEPQKKYRLNYRMVVFDGELKAEEAEDYWQAFAHPPEVVAIKN